MISLKQFMEVVDYRITEGSDFTWTCFGDHAYTLSSWNHEQDGHSFSVTFDTQTQEVFMVESCDYKNQRAYRLINPDWVHGYNDYADRENPEYKNQAWDGVDYIDLEEASDWIDKALAIKDGEDYDTRVSIPITLSQDDTYELMKLAHERDVTLNQLVESILWDAIERRQLEDLVVEYKSIEG